MAAGYLVNTVCYSSVSDATDAFYGSSVPVNTAGSSGYVSWFEKVSGVWKLRRQSINNTGVITELSTTNLSTPSFTPCDTASNFLDGVTVGWGIATAMVMAWCYSMIRKQAR